MRFGEIIELKTYQKICKPEHFFIKYRGFAISTSELYEMMETNVKTIRIIYLGKEGLKVYVTTARAYLEDGIDFDNDGDKQKVLPTAKMVEL